MSKDVMIVCDHCGGYVRKHKPQFSLYIKTPQSVKGYSPRIGPMDLCSVGCVAGWAKNSALALAEGEDTE